jgi:hypothetical protein
LSSLFRSCLSIRISLTSIEVLTHSSHPYFVSPTSLSLRSLLHLTRRSHLCIVLSLSLLL